MTWVWGAAEELLPIVVFFIVQLHYSFVTAVAVMLGVTALVLLTAQLSGSGVPRFALVSTAAVTVFAVPTIITGDSSYVTVSDTILDGGFALLLLGSLCTRRPLLEYFFRRIFALPTSAWRTLTLRWGLLFLAIAAANEYVRLHYSLDVWAQFKLLSTVGILLFGLWQFRLSARERIVAESNRLGLRVHPKSPSAN